MWIRIRINKYGSGSTKLLNKDPIRILNTGFDGGVGKGGTYLGVH